MAERYTAIPMTDRGELPMQKVVLATDYDAIAAELADWQRMRNEAMAVAEANRDRIRELEAELNEQARVNGMGGSREAALMAKVARLEAALEFAQLAIDDLLHLYAAELCDDDAVARTRSRVTERGGTLAYIAEVQASLRTARGSEMETFAESAIDQAPIARVIVTDDAPAGVVLYAPGLPPGEFDVYLEPTETACVRKPMLSDMSDALIRELHRQDLVSMRSEFDGATLRIDPL